MAGLVSIELDGGFDNIEKFFKRDRSSAIKEVLTAYARQGVEALAASTPVDSGATAAAWSYEVKVTKDSATISWLNTSKNGGVNIAVILQYGHGTGTGGYVRGRDYINPAIQPIMDHISAKVGEVVRQ